MAQRNPLREIVAKLTSDGVRSRYLDRLRDRFASLRPSVPPPRTETPTHDPKEMSELAAAALANAAGAVDLALLHVELAQRRLETAVECGAPLEHVQKLVGTFNDHRDSAVDARDQLKVHRESVGIRQTRLLFKLYPVPPRR
jgi:hypothetical protein